MSVNYASGLSAYMNKGKCGAQEYFDNDSDLSVKIEMLKEWIKSSKKTIIHTGAGISTSAGIPDFRGPNGVWTLEQKGLKPEVNGVTFDNAIPTKTHMAIVALESAGYLTYVINQNVDGLNLRSGFPYDRLSDLHGNMFVEFCSLCGARFIRATSNKTMGLRRTGRKCQNIKKKGQRCRGFLQDSVLDWEDSLPDDDLELCDKLCRTADLSITLGTSLQIVPAARLPLLTKTKSKGKVVIVNLQKTKYDKNADLVINARTDDVLTRICESLKVHISPFYRPTIMLHSANKSMLINDFAHRKICIVDPKLFNLKRELTLDNTGDMKIAVKKEIQNSDNDIDTVKDLLQSMVDKLSLIDEL